MRQARLLSILAVLCFCAGAMLAARGTSSAAAAGQRHQRSFLFRYEVTVPPNPERGAHLWIPVPRSDAHQTIRDLKITSEASYKMGGDSLYGDTFAMFSPDAALAAAGYRVVMTFHVTRREYGVNLHAPALRNAPARIPSGDRLLQRYLEPDKLVPLNATIAELAKEHTKGAATALEKARELFTYVASTMRYDKSGDGWGRGDEMWACDSKRGNCTDFHSVLIGMLRSSGIPARFEIGFQIPEDKREGEIPGYHCWAEFYVSGAGWIPVDASEASRNPAKREYFFGTVDADRVMFTYGRDIQLSAEQKGEPLNYFIYPYAEANGQPIKNLQTRFSFRELSGSNPVEKSAGGLGL